VSFAADAELEDGVLIGTDANLQGLIDENEFLMVEFYAPWCGHCKALTPEYASAAATLVENEVPVKLVKVDATEHTEAAEQYEVQGYPTIKWFNSGKASEFNGGRTADEIVQWITKKTGPAAIPVETVEDAKALVDKNPIVAFGFFATLTDAEALRFSEAADVSENTFLITDKPEVAAEYGVEMPSVVVYTDFDEKKFVYSGDFTTDDIALFVAGSSLPLVTEFSEETAPKIFGGDIKSHCLFFQKFSDETWAGHLEQFTGAAKAYKGKALFITLDVDKEDNGRILEFFGIDEAQTPTYRIINVEGEMAKFAPPNNDVTTEAISGFVASYLDGTLKPHLNSEEVPEDWDATPVKTLVGKNFVEVALDPTKDVFVEFYAPWCGHCKALAPVWDQLGEAFESSGVVLGKMDSTANDVEAVTVESFPTLFLFPKGEDAEKVECDAERDLTSLAEWIVEKTGVEMPTLPEEAAAPEGEEEEEGDESADGAGEGESAEAAAPHGDEL
jgi:protein disulfide-isomerase A1